MNTYEACDLLEVPMGASNLEVKTAFKKKAIEYHPDRNKDPGAEETFKKINEAYQFLEKHGTNAPAYNDVKSPFYDPSSDFAEEIKRRMDEMFPKVKVETINQPIVVNLYIPFNDAVLGCYKDVTYIRTVPCPTCKGGQVKVPCTKCNGSGKRKYGTGAVQASDSRELPCNACVGTGSISGARCPDCRGLSTKKIQETVPIRVPAGIQTGTRLKLSGEGNYNSKGSYDDLSVIANVLPSDKGLTLSGDDVISTVEISLLEALKGTRKSLSTVKGDKVLEFKPKLKNGDRIRVSGFGVPAKGSHIFIINVIYPDDVSELIRVLEPKDPAPSEVIG